MVQFGPMEQTTFKASLRGWAGLYVWKLDQASRKPLTRLHAGALRRTVRGASSGHAYAVLPSHGIEAWGGARIRGLGV
jgi:hypothetical protein